MVKWYFFSSSYVFLNHLMCLKLFMVFIGLILFHLFIYYMNKVFFSSDFLDFGAAITRTVCAVPNV